MLIGRVLYNSILTRFFETSAFEITIVFTSRLGGIDINISLPQLTICYQNNVVSKCETLFVMVV